MSRLFALVLSGLFLGAAAFIIANGMAVRATATHTICFGETCMFAAKYEKIDDTHINFWYDNKKTEVVGPYMIREID